MALSSGLKLAIRKIKAKIAAVITADLKAWHKMTATTWTGSNRLPDDSGNSNTAALYTGRGLSFDGVNDVVTIGNTGQTVKTVIFYVYPDTTTEVFMQLQSAGAVRIEIASGTLSATGFTSPTLYVNGAASSTVAATTWQMIAVTSATGVSASNVLLGQSNTDYGSIDMSNVKFFSTELTAGQVAELYANPEQVLPTGGVAADLVGWWPLNNGVGISIDGSITKKHGSVSGATLVNFIESPLGQTSLKGIDKYMFFDGVNDVVNFSSISAPANITLSIWLLIRGTGVSNGRICRLGNFLLLEIADLTRIRVFPSNSSSGNFINAAFNTSNILHFVYSQTGTTAKTYVNGVLQDTATVDTAVSTTLGDFTLGAYLPTFTYSNNLIFNFSYYNDVLSDSAISEIFTNGLNFNLVENYGNYTNSANLVGWWKNRGNRNGDWVDLKGSNNGTISGTPTEIYIQEGYESGKSLLGQTLLNTNSGEIILNGDGYALITDAATLDITTNITLEAWVKPFTVSTAQTIIGKNTAYALGLTSAGKPVFTKWTSAASTATATTTTALTVNTWYHIAVTYDGTNVKIYIDGAIDTTTAVSGAIDSTSTDVLMGALTTSTELFSGYIDSVKIYSSDLTAAQVAENYNAETAAHSNA